MADLKIGSKVFLKSNPKNAMTIDSIDGNKITCVWIDKNGVPHREIYEKDTLED